MHNQINHRECVAVIGSMTMAMQAQNVLASAAVRARLIKADSRYTRLGCAYALSFSCLQLELVKQTLQNAGITVQAFYGGESR